MVAEQLPRHPEVKGSSPIATGTGDAREVLLSGKAQYSWPPSTN